MLKVYQVTHLVPLSTVTISLSRFKSTAIGNGLEVSVSGRSENLSSKELATLSVRILLDDLSIDMVMVKREHPSRLLGGVASSHDNVIRATLKKARKQVAKN